MLATRGGDTSMSDVAAAAGVARATVYRYFPNRQALLDELGELAVREAGDRLVAARIDAVPVHEGITRAVRALVEVGNPLVVLVREAPAPDSEAFEDRVASPLRRLVEAGQSSGDIRDDIPGPWLIDVLVGLVVSVLSSPRTLGREDTVAAITSLFLDGAHPRRPSPSSPREAPEAQ